MLTVTKSKIQRPTIQIHEFSDCRNNSSAITASDFLAMKAMYEDIVARGVQIPPHIAEIAKNLGIA